MHRQTRLAQALVRRAALALPDSTFMGWKHFLSELNKFVNEHVRKAPGDPLTFVTFKGEPTEAGATLDVYLDDAEERGFNPRKMLQAVRYFSEEMGIQVGPEKFDPDHPESVMIPLQGLSTYEAPDNHGQLQNQWMKSALKHGEAVDVRMVGMETEPGVFRLDGFIDGVTYVDAQEEMFIQSIGEDLESGEILAATDSRFYTSDDYKCIYLK